MPKYVVTILWSDGIDAGKSDYCDDLAEVGMYIMRECARVGKDGEYPEGIYPEHINVILEDA